MWYTDVDGLEVLKGVTGGGSLVLSLHCGGKLRVLVSLLDRFFTFSFLFLMNSSSE